jgi:hypothetical protein
MVVGSIPSFASTSRRVRSAFLYASVVCMLRESFTVSRYRSIASAMLVEVSV